MSATACSIIFEPVVKDRSIMASLNKYVGIHILTSNAEFHVAHLVGDWGDSLGEFLKFIEAGGDVSRITDVWTTLGVIPLQETKGRVFFLSIDHEVSQSLKDTGVWIGCSFFVGNRNGEANAQGCQCVRNNVFSCFLRVSGFAFFGGI